MSEDIVAVLDANVLYPFYLREFLMRLSRQAELFRAKWTNEINDEWSRNLAANKPHLSKSDIEATVKWMNQTIEDALVDSAACIHLAREMKLPDPDDAHVLAAALVAKAQYIVTKNLKDFPDRVLSQYGIEAIHPDDFIFGFAISSEVEVLATLMRMSNQYSNPQMSPRDVLARLQNEIPKTCAKIGSVLEA